MEILKVKEIFTHQRKVSSIDRYRIENKVRHSATPDTGLYKIETQLKIYEMLHQR